NLDGVTAMTSLMLAKLVRFYQKVKTAEGRVALSELSPELYRKFEWTRLTRVFRIFSKKEEALRGVQQDRG
ncbi:MAG TPA: STAS domain-containing protein, partial [Streptosporangiaceae bacterium]|nr:STAS domain-containing protein [Streptosporangiaceae bacterium]